MSRHDSSEQQNPDKTIRDSNLAVLGKSLRLLVEICKEEGVQARGERVLSATALPFALFLETCPDESGARQHTRKNPAGALAFLELAHSFLYKLRGGSATILSLPSPDTTPFHQLARAVEEFCEEEKYPGYLQEDWDRIDLP